MHDDDEDGGVWPAYVAAVAGLLLSLLLLSAIMALVMFVLGLVVGNQIAPDNPAATTTATPAPAATPPSLTSPTPPIGTTATRDTRATGHQAKPASPPRRPPTAQARAGTPSEATQPGGGQTERARVTFQGDALQLDSATRAQLKKEVARLLKAGQQHWRLSLRTQTDNPARSRAGYLRLLALRSLLLDAGVDPLEIDTQLLNAPPAGNNDASQTVDIASLPLAAAHSKAQP